MARVLQPVDTVLAVELVDRADHFAALETPWDELLADSAAESLALTHAWLSTWWEVFGEGRSLCVLLVRAPDGEIVGAAPLLRRSVRHRGVLPFERLELLASGEDQADEIDSDYLDLILRRGHERAALAAILGYLTHGAPFEWHELVLAGLRQASPTPWLVEHLAPGLGLRRPMTNFRPGVVLPLPATVEELRRGPLKDLLADVRRRARRLASHGQVRLFWTTSGAELERHFPALVALHQARWLQDGKPGVFASDKFTRFHQQLAPMLADRGQAKLALLELDGRPVAARYVFVYRGALLGYQAAWDVELDRRLGLGKILTAFVIEEAVREGLHTVDFLKGVTPYKRHWSKETHHQVDLRLDRPSMRARVRDVVEVGFDVARFLRERRRSAER